MHRVAGAVWQRRVMLVAALAVSAAACRPGAHPGDVSDSTFVAIMTALRREVQPGGPETMRDSAGRQAIRDSILKSYHTTAAALESTASHLADRPSHASDILRAIDKKVQTLGQIAPPRPPAPQPAAVATPPATSPGAATPARPQPTPHS